MKRDRSTIRGVDSKASAKSKRLESGYLSQLGGRVDLSIKLVENESEMKEVLRIRKTVFVEEQNIPKDRERDGLDEKATHFLVKFRNRPIGAARARFLGNTGKLERISLLRSYRRRGYGKRMVDYLVKYCEEKGVSEIVLYSQLYLKEFYERCGFKSRGKIFFEAGAKHIEMYRKV